jgi:hypothetical protein
MPEDLRCKTVELRWEDIQITTKGWHHYNTVDRQERHLHANSHDQPQEGNFCNKQGNMAKPYIVADSNCHMGDKGDKMANS